MNKPMPLNVLRSIVMLALTSAVAYHAIAMVAIIDNRSCWHHLMFVFIDLIVLYGFATKLPYFRIAFAGFTLQQYYAHGKDLFDLWIIENQVDWISLGVLIIMPCALWLLRDMADAEQ